MQSVISAWVEAGKQLGIKVVAPYHVKDKTGRLHQFSAFIPDFGSRKGALVLIGDPPDLNCDPDALACARETEYWFTILNSEDYSVFDHDLFTSTLDDWGG